MVAYSFKKKFVAPIRVGLGLQSSVPTVRLDGRALIPIFPKRQTIRADRKRHARPGEELQLYAGMRTKHCFLIGRARCIDVQPIQIWIPIDDAWLAVGGKPISDSFARADGFGSVEDMWLFWRKEHPDVRDFRGVLIKWEPL